MKLLLDENLPKKLKYRFDDTFEVLTVPEMGWAGIKNGELLKSMVSNEISVLITLDRNMGKQQNLQKFGITLVFLIAVDTRYASLLKLFSKLTKRLSDTLNPVLSKSNNY